MAADAHKKAIVTKTAASAGINEQVYLQRTVFDSAISAHGYEATIERRLRCPCIAEGVGHPATGCVNCGGTGHFFID